MSNHTVDQEDIERTIKLTQKDRLIFKQDIVRIQETVNKVVAKELPSENDINVIEPILEQLNKSKQALIRTDQRLIHLCVDWEDEDKANKLEEELFKEIETVNTTVWELKGKINQIKRKIPSSETTCQSIASSTFLSETAHSNPARVKLPDIPVPKFDGNLRNFTDFCNLFESVIHNDPALTPIQKFYFLRGALIGESEFFLKGINSIGDHYEQTWKDFCNEYGKKRLIISAHLFDLFNLSAIKNDSNIRELVNSIDVAVRGLTQCGEKTESWSVLLSYLLLSKLDYKTRSDFENTITSNDAYPSYQSLRDFLNIQAANSAQRELQKPTSERKVGDRPKSSLSITSNKTKCCICQAPHLLIECSLFNKKTPAERLKSVSSAKLCVNCFNRNHTASECRRSGCSICGNKHHRLLHIEKSEPSETKSDSPETKSESSGVSKSSFNILNPASLSASLSETIILPTAVVQFSCGDFTGSACILIDSGSQVSLISKEFVERNGLAFSPSSSSTTIHGVSGGLINATHECLFNLKSRFSGFNLSLKADVVPENTFTYRLSNLQFGAIVDKLKLLTLADPAFTKPVINIPIVNIIIGAEHYLKIIGSIKPKHKVVDGVELFLTNFGWVIIGKAPP